MRVPLSFIIDDSTCLVNMGRFCMPQFAAAWPDRRGLQEALEDLAGRDPRRVSARVRPMVCRAQGVKGKYSVVPYPACVGWLDRELPGWSAENCSTACSWCAN